MNFVIFQQLVQSTLEHFRCQGCCGTIQPTNIAIETIQADQAVLEIICPHCGVSGKIQATMNIRGTSYTSQQKPQETEGETLHESDIIQIRDELKHTKKVSDLFTPPQHD